MDNFKIVLIIIVKYVDNCSNYCKGAENAVVGAPQKGHSGIASEYVEEVS